jgi:outer membrane protein
LTVQTLAQQIKAIEVLVNQTKETLQLARQRYQLGLSSIVEVTQGEVAVTSAETKLAETLYEEKAAEAQLARAIGEGLQGLS